MLRVRHCCLFFVPTLENWKPLAEPSLSELKRSQLLIEGAVFHQFRLVYVVCCVMWRFAVYLS